MSKTVIRNSPNTLKSLSDTQNLPNTAQNGFDQLFALTQQRSAGIIKL
jgi:hypothetical protein